MNIKDYKDYRAIHGITNFIFQAYNMQKQWFPERHDLDTLAALMKNFIHYLNFNVSKFTIEKDAQSSGHVTNFTLATIMKLLEKWTIKYSAFKCPIDRVKDIASPSLLYITENGAGEFIMYKSINDNNIEYLHPRKGWVIEDFGLFKDKFGVVGVALSAQSIDKPEPNFLQREKDYEAKRLANPALKKVRLVENFLTDTDCDYIIKLAESEFKPSGLGIENQVGEGRTSYSAELHIFPKDQVLNGILIKAADFLNVEPSHFEYFQCVSYDKTQEYDRHYDTFDTTTEVGKKEVAKNGQRKYTMLAYLNDDFIGGQTYFPYLDLLIEPKKGSVVIFENLDEEGNVLRTSFHAGLPVTSGRKYAMNMWVRTKPIRSIEY